MRYSSGGWKRLYVVVGVAWTVVVGSVMWWWRPTQESVDRTLSAELSAIVREHYRSANMPADSVDRLFLDYYLKYRVTPAEGESSKRHIARLGERYGDSIQAVRERYGRYETALTSRAKEHGMRAMVITVLPLVLLWILGWSIGWVARGFTAQ